jgi:hypothetical protein
LLKRFDAHDEIVHACRRILVIGKSLGSVLKDGRKVSIVEVVRIQDTGITFDLAGVAAWYGMELSRLFVDHCLPPA